MVKCQIPTHRCFFLFEFWSHLTWKFKFVLDANLCWDIPLSCIGIRGLYFAPLPLSCDMFGSTTIFYGGVINPLAIDSFSALPHCLICVDPEGNIAWIIDDVEPQNLQENLAMKGLVDAEIITLRDGEFIIPGFIDTHSVSQ